MCSRNITSLKPTNCNSPTYPSNFSPTKLLIGHNFVVIYRNRKSTIHLIIASLWAVSYIHTWVINLSVPSNCAQPGHLIVLHLFTASQFFPPQFSCVPFLFSFVLCVFSVRYKKFFRCFLGKSWEFQKYISYFWTEITDVGCFSSGLESLRVDDVKPLIQ